MTFASSAFGQLSYITETTPGTIPVVGNKVNLRMTSPTAKAAVTTVKSAEIRPDRLSTGQTRTDINIDGGFNFELSGREYDPFLEGVIGGTFAHHGAGGLGTPASITTTPSTITAAAAPTTTSAYTTLDLGSWFKVVPPTNASAAVKEYFNDKWFKVHAVTEPSSTVITLDPSTPIAAPGIGALGAGYSISQSVMSNGAGTRAFSLEYAMTDIGQFVTFSGMRTNSLELSIEVGAIITGSFGFLGAAAMPMVSASRLPGVAVPSQALEVMNAVTDVGLIYEGGANILSGTNSFIKSVKFNMSNGLRGQKAVGVFGNAGVGYGELEIGGSLEIYVEDGDYYNKWLAGTNTNLAFGVADAAGNGYLIEMDKVNFTDGAMNPGGRTDDVMLTLPFSAFYDATTGRGIRVTRAVAAGAGE